MSTDLGISVNPDRYDRKNLDRTAILSLALEVWKTWIHILALLPTDLLTLRRVDWSLFLHPG